MISTQPGTATHHLVIMSPSSIPWVTLLSLPPVDFSFPWQRATALPIPEAPPSPPACPSPINLHLHRHKAALLAHQLHDGNAAAGAGGLDLCVGGSWKRCGKCEAVRHARGCVGQCDMPHA